MKKINFLLGLVFCRIFFSCSFEETKDNSITKNEIIKEAFWILGKWQNVSSEVAVYEQWEKLNDSTFAGQGLYVKGTDTLSKETLTLEQHGSDLFYIPTVSNQNEGKPVSFKLVSSKEDELVFENPEHDFPQKITYTKINTDSLVANISGMVKGEEQTVTFPMQRVR